MRIPEFTRLFLLFQQLFGAFIDQGLQVVGVFLHHGHHVVENVGLPANAKAESSVVERAEE